MPNQDDELCSINEMIAETGHLVGSRFSIPSLCDRGFLDANGPEQSGAALA